jgi:hypothetical protein
MEQGLEFFLMNDQPVTCPNCGNRTDFFEIIDENNEVIQLHQCPDIECQFKFQMVEN